MLPTDFHFTLPRGFLDAAGHLHQQGVMRLATARDEIAVQKDHRAQASPADSELVMLSRVILQLGTLPDVTSELLEGLFTRDLGYLREFYNRINQQGNAQVAVRCPTCDARFHTELVLAGEWSATPLTNSMRR
jgi:hypothetical protein